MTCQVRELLEKLPYWFVLFERLQEKQTIEIKWTKLVLNMTSFKYEAQTALFKDPVRTAQ